MSDVDCIIKICINQRIESEWQWKKCLGEVFKNSFKETHSQVQHTQHTGRWECGSK